MGTKKEITEYQILTQSKQLAHADADGVESIECKELAKLHSDAVDFPKTGNSRIPYIRPNRLFCFLGVPVALPKELGAKHYPHFMEKAKDKTYPAKSILGKLYDQVCEIMKEQPTGI
mgnify:CR=1 FL=1